MESSGDFLVRDIEVDIWSRRMDTVETETDVEIPWHKFMLSSKGKKLLNLQKCLLNPLAKIISAAVGTTLFILFIIVIQYKMRKNRTEKLDPEEVERRKTDDLIGLLSNNESLIRFAN